MHLTQKQKLKYKSIENIKGEFTIIIIAHRISTIKHADKIFMIDKGELINSGTFNELKKKCEQFNLLISNQEV